MGPIMFLIVWFKPHMVGARSIADTLNESSHLSPGRSARRRSALLGLSRLSLTGQR